VPYFVTSRTRSSRPVFRGEIASLAIEQLLADRDRYGFLLPAFVFMPDHAHFVIVPDPSYSISDTMRVIKGSIARCINRSGGGGPVWQEGFYERAPRTRAELNSYIEYIHHNPVTAGMVERDEDYAYSSARDLSLVDYQRFFEEVRG